MKIVVIGGTGLIGSKVVSKLRALGHEALAASPNSGVNTLTGEGVREALTGATVVVDVSNSPSFEDAAVMAFFETSTRTLLAAEAELGVRHHVALSVVGTERLSESGYFRAKIVQETKIKAGNIPYSIVHATQFYEFVKSIADGATTGETVRLAPAFIQPMAAEEVADAVTRVALGAPLGGTVEIAGPERWRLDELIRRGLLARQDVRQVVADPAARYFGALLNDSTLLPSFGARLGTIGFDAWLTAQGTPPPPRHVNPSPETMIKLVTEARTIAMVGASSNFEKASNRIMKSLLDAGFRVIPVNPNETEVNGQRAYPTLDDVPEDIDIVDVFRRSEEAPRIAEEAIARRAKVLWLQPGVTSEEAARRAEAAGLAVVTDKCIGAVALHIPRPA
jgi:predicted CoA-binding protein/uncharacterized protein YbjT (DUF2867 family)